MYSTSISLKGILLFMYPLLIQAYQVKCPSYPQWKIRGDVICKNSWKYTCLLNTNDNIYSENCEFSLNFLGPESVVNLNQRYKFVISGSLDRTSCGSEMIQPFSLLSNTSSKCVTRKSQCNGEGQVVYSDGTTTDDRSCSCNYIDNFAFVTRPKSKCFCIPSQEDCSCYYKPCPVGNFLTPDYECVHLSQWTGNFYCTEMQERKSTDVVTKQVNFDTELRQDSTYFTPRLMASITASTILAIAFASGLIIFCQKYRSLKVIVKRQSSENDLDFENTRGIIYYMKEKLRESELPSLNDNSKESFENVADTVSVSKETLNRENQLELFSLDDNSRGSFEIVTDTISVIKGISLKAIKVATKSGIYFSDSALVQTRPVKLIYEILSEKDFLTITGVSGSGKSVILYQLAEKMCQQEGYQIVTANKPSDVLAKNDDYFKQLFVFDDVCGKFSFDPILADNWNLRSAKIRKILKENRTKIIFSCRANISKEPMFQSVSILADNICDIQSSEFSMTTEDNLNIAASYNLHEIDLDRLKTTNDFKSIKCIPMFCNLYNVLRTDDTNVLNFFSNCKEILEDKIRLIANSPICSTIFFFFVIYNNKLGKSFAKDNQSIMNEIGESLFHADEVIDAVQRCRLFVKKNNDSFFICHDMVFDILVSFVSQRRFDDVLKFACLDILCERCHFESIGIGPDYGCIKIPFHKEELYFKSVFHNVVDIKNNFFQK